MHPISFRCSIDMDIAVLYHVRRAKSTFPQIPPRTALEYMHIRQSTHRTSSHRQPIQASRYLPRIFLSLFLLPSPHFQRTAMTSILLSLCSLFGPLASVELLVLYFVLQVCATLASFSVRGSLYLCRSRADKQCFSACSISIRPMTLSQGKQ
ncbi:hypothetical protein BD289DRAFT_164614 [Coniella lustricola]|uniref:Uncharacterized protein n=1 Tax=Coniella lustricola TaxID=2025994 RepID=A0A2T2ZUC7_9PEZI|nr:hypothetical protein BD289DRAFT_164614 [Coniella lustricola]